MESPVKETLTRSPLRDLSPSPPPRSFSPATPELLYRTAFAEECEALALRAAATAAGSPTPLRTFRPLRLPSTIEAETLTPLWTNSIHNETFTYTPPLPPSSPSHTFCVEASACSSGLHRTFEWEAAPLVTSTPAPQTGEINAGGGSGSSLRMEEKGGPPGEARAKKRRISSESSPPCCQAPEGAALGGKGAPGKVSVKKRRLSPGNRPPRCSAPEGAALGGKGAPGKASGGGPKKEEGARVSRPRLGKKQLPSGMKNKVPQEKKSAPLTQLHSVGSSVACQGPKLQGDNKPSRSKLPVPAGLDGRRIDEALVAAGQIPRDAPGCASCLQCQRLLKKNQLLVQENQYLAQENQHLKTMLENFQGGNTS